MDAIGRTRMNLLLLKRRIEVAERGLELLRSKREALVREFFALVDRMAEHRQQIDLALRQACSSLAFALGREGRAPVRSAAFAAKRSWSIEITERNVWGVRFPDLHYAPVLRPLDGRGYAVHGVSPAIDDTARRFENILDAVLGSITEELRLKKLGAEIKKVTRRINALNEIMIPGLRRHVREIHQTLEEREREEVFRMKRFKLASE